MPAKKPAKKTATKKSVTRAATKRASTKPNRKMSAEHKEALARGRNEGRAVRAYLGALDQAAKPGRRVSKDELEKRLADIRDEIAAEADPVKRLELIQKRLDLEERLSDQGNDVDLAQLEADFVAAAAGYAKRKGISYSAFRESGVPAATLKAAGIPRTRKS